MKDDYAIDVRVVEPHEPEPVAMRYKDLPQGSFFRAHGGIAGWLKLDEGAVNLYFADLHRHLFSPDESVIPIEGYIVLVDKHTAEYNKQKESN